MKIVNKTSFEHGAPPGVFCFLLQQLNILYFVVCCSGGSFRSQLYPVLVWIYGGGFLTGSARSFLPLQLVHKGLMVTHYQVWWVWSWPVAGRRLSSGDCQLSRRSFRIPIPWHSWGDCQTHQKAKYILQGSGQPGFAGPAHGLGGCASQYCTFWGGPCQGKIY